MKRTVAVLVLLLSSAVVAQAPQAVVSVDAFVPALSPYGNWVSVNGVRAFRPSVAVVGADFVPYASAGQWVWTDVGWTFESSLPFGWATFHYGRWWFSPEAGWVWIPDTNWGPAWVEWRFGGGYAGWAPLAPQGFFSAGYRPRWFFVEAPHLGSRNLFHHALPADRFDRAFSSSASVPVGRHSWHVGPSYAEVSRHSASRIEERPVPPPVPPRGVFAPRPMGSPPPPVPPTSTRVLPPPRWNGPGTMAPPPPAPPAAPVTRPGNRPPMPHAPPPPSQRGEHRH